MKIHWKKWLMGFVIFIILIGCYGLGVNFYMKASVEGKILSDEDATRIEADCILVLGAGVREDGTPSPLLQERLDMGVRLYDLGASAKLLMSGDHGRAGYDEVNKMKEYAVENGVSSHDVFMDHAGFSTYESMYRARDVFQAKKLIIVTQQYHLYRALYVAEKLGLEAYGVAADQMVYNGQLYREVREILARNKDFINTLIWPKPKYLGDAIPVNGDGDITNDKGEVNLR
ncbi:vancomycin high temperature exclusion protein [Clostridiales bacterium CHKCI001]|nr:vancomycin high temperature exclusion protein [Clostridiales bacterium CHKCI001]